MDVAESFSSSIHYFWREACACETVQELVLKLQAYDKRNIKTEKALGENLPPAWCLIYCSLEREIANYELDLRIKDQKSLFHFNIIESIQLLVDKYTPHLRVMCLEDLQSLLDLALCSQPFSKSRVLIIWYFIILLMRINIYGYEINKLFYEKIH
jgi:hypothetical protein